MSMLSSKVNWPEQVLRLMRGEITDDFVRNTILKYGKDYLSMDPEKLAELGKNWSNTKGLALLPMVRSMAGVTGAGVGGWMAGRKLGRTPLITDPNMTYDDYYQNLFGRYLNNTQNRNQGWKDILSRILNSGNAYAEEAPQILPQQSKRMAYMQDTGETQIPFIPMGLESERFQGYDPNSEDRFKYYK